MSRGTEVPVDSKSDQCPLIAAICHKDKALPMALKLQTLGALVKGVGKPFSFNCRRALLAASEKGNAQVVDLLLEHGVGVDPKLAKRIETRTLAVHIIEL